MTKNSNFKQLENLIVELGSIVADEDMIFPISVDS